MQAQPLMRRQRLWVGIQPVTQQRVADRQHVHAQLVRAPGDRRQLDPAVVAAALDDAPERQRMLALLVVHHMAWLGWRVVAQRQVDAAAVQCRLAPAQCGVGLFGFAVVELARQLAVAVGIAGQQDDAGGFPVQAVHDQRVGVAVFLQAGDQAVLVVLGAAGYRQQQGRFVDHQDGGVFVQDLDVGQRHCVFSVKSGEKSGAALRPIRGTRPLLQGNAIPCRSGLVPRMGCKAAPAFSQISDPAG
ncbi:hypothetical protein D3C81_1412970 [compost metagenome]